MLALIVLYALCYFFVDYQGHVMGALIERDMRHELFEHYQTLSTVTTIKRRVSS